LFPGRAHGKLILFGEHAAVYGYPAVGLGIPISLSVELEAGEGNGIAFPGMSPEESELFSSAILRAVRIEPALGTIAGSLRVTSDIPSARGFGSSGALCSATARALESAISRPGAGIDDEQVWRLAHEMEGAFHGSPSGIDTGLALVDGLALLRPRAPDLPAVSSLYGCPFALIAGCLPRKSSTGELVGALRRRIDAREGATVRAIAELGEIAESSASRFQTVPAAPEKDPPIVGASGFAALISRAQELLASLGLSTPALDRAIAAGLRHGGLAGKLSGAGGGGAFFVLFETVADAGAAIPGIGDAFRDLPVQERPVLFALQWDGRSVALLPAPGTA